MLTFRLQLYLISMSKAKHPANMALLTESEHILSNFAHICPTNKSVEGLGKRLVPNTLGV